MPVVDRTPAILLRRIKLTETSLILSWLTRDAGRLKTVAKGARRPKSRFAGVLDLFYECDLHFARSQRSELHTLREAELLETFAAVRTDYSRLRLASYFSELVELATEPEQPVPEVYSLLRRALAHLAAQPATRRALTFFEDELARDLGFMQRANQSGVQAIESSCGRLPRTRSSLLAALP